MLMTSLLSLLFLKGSYLTFFDNSGSAINLMMTGLFKSSVVSGPERIGEVLILLVLAILIPLFSIIAIFLFKRRNLQLMLVKFIIAIIIAFIATSVVYSFIVISKYDASFGSWYKLLIPIIQLIISVLAFSGIKKDDDLVKSYDRLR
jgi:hypothetical protein